MPQPTHLDPSAYSFDALEESAVREGGVGALLIHGFTGSVAETRPMGQYLAARGMSVRCPLLPGHGTTPSDLTRIGWQAWADEVESALKDLQSRCLSVFAGGLSMGSLLALWLGLEHSSVRGLLLMAPAVRVRNRMAPLALGLRHLLDYSPFGAIGDDDLGDPESIECIWCYDEVPLWGAGEFYILQRHIVKNLPGIRQPVLVFQGRRDAQIAPGAAQFVCDSVSSVDKTLVWLENSGHNLLVDAEREALWAQSYAWMMERVPSRGR